MASAVKRLMQEYKELTLSQTQGMAAGPIDEESDLLTWEAVITGPEGTWYEYGVFTAILKFPPNYPMHPPKMTFTCPMFHPNSNHKAEGGGRREDQSIAQWRGNKEESRDVREKDIGDEKNLMRRNRETTVYADGRVCISILHDPSVDDPTRYEQACERWSPAQSVEKILLSVMSMLAEPNDESPANIDAAKLYRMNRTAFNERVLQTVKKSLGVD